MSDALTIQVLRKAMQSQPTEMPAKPYFVVPPCLEQAAREAFGSAAEIIVQKKIPNGAA